MGKDNSIAVMLPAYNEEENVSQMVNTWLLQAERLKKVWNLNLDIIVVNDGSSDKTKEICEELNKTYTNFTLVNHSRNKGLGEAMKTGINYILKHFPDSRFVCVMDCDNTQDPKYIVDMLKKSQQADVVIASRYQKGSKIQGVAKHRLLTSEGARFVYGALLNVKNVRDYTCGYRLYKRKILEKCSKRFGEKIIEESGFTCMAELLYKIHCVGGKFAEIPFELRYDFKKGISKMNVLKTAVNSITLAFRLRRIKK